MITYRQAISDLRGSNKLLSSDILIPDRLIGSKLRNAANLIVSRQLNKRKLWQSPNLFTPILCLEMEKVPLTSCCDYVGDKKIARSIKTLPQIGEGVFGLAIQSVTGLDGQKKFKEVTPTRYANLLKLNLNTKEVYYWLQNGHLYVSNEDTAIINMLAYFTEDVPNDLLFPGADCNCIVPPDVKDLCTNPLDKPFRFPAEYLKDIQDMVADELNKTFHRLKVDETSDNKPD